MLGPVRRAPQTRSISLARLCALYDWTTRQVEHRRAKWTEGVHYARISGEIRYYWEAIEQWIDDQAYVTSAESAKSDTTSEIAGLQKSSLSRIHKLV